jgi:hypothetical protein
MLIFDGFKYVFGYTPQTNVIRWRCFMKNCCANNIKYKKNPKKQKIFNRLKTTEDVITKKIPM